MKYNCMITFKSIHEVMKLEEVLIDNDLSVDIAPLPRKISDSCGMGIVFDLGDFEHVKKLAKENDLDYKKVYSIENGNFEVL